MNKSPLLFLVISFLKITSLQAQFNSSGLPVWNEAATKISLQDWLVKPVSIKAAIYKTADRKDIILYNGLVKRVFRIQPNVACIDFTNLTNSQQLLRAIKPEAFIIIDGVNYNIGGLHGQKERACLLPAWLDGFTAHDSDFHFLSFEITDLKSFINWKNTNWAMNSRQPTGKTISFLYQSSLSALKNIIVKVNYELYDGLPLIVKWVSVENKRKRQVCL